MLVIERNGIVIVDSEKKEGDKILKITNLEKTAYIHAYMEVNKRLINLQEEMKELKEKLSNAQKVEKVEESGKV
jgi:hypothetical protein